jgi:hypothetical protein
MNYDKLIFANTEFGSQEEFYYKEAFERKIGKLLNRYIIPILPNPYVTEGCALWFKPSWGTNAAGFAKYRMRMQVNKLSLAPLTVVINYTGQYQMDDDERAEWLLYMWERAGVTNTFPAGLEEKLATKSGAFSIQSFSSLADLLTGSQIVPYSEIKTKYMPLIETPETDTKGDFIISDYADSFSSLWNEAVKAAKDSFYHKEMSPEEAEARAKDFARYYRKEADRSHGWTGD